MFNTNKNKISHNTSHEGKITDADLPPMKPGRDSFVAKLSYENGNDIVVSFDFPEGLGVSVLAAIRSLSTNDYVKQIITEMAVKGDPSVIAMLEDFDRKNPE